MAQRVEIKGVGPAEFPDDMPKDDILDFLRRKFTQAAAFAGPAGRFAMGKGATDAELSVIEPAATIASAAIAEPISGLAGIAGALAEGPEAGADVVRRVQEGLTFQPQTKAGQEGLAAVGEALAPVGEFIQGAEQNLGNKTLAATDSPALAAIAHTLPTAVMEAATLGTFGALTRPLSKIDLYSPKIFGGALAKNADVDALTTAKNLEATGATRDQIWKDTGWFNDGGDWKFEIDDSQRSFTPKEDVLERDLVTLRAGLAEATAAKKAFISDNMTEFRSPDIDPLRKEMIKDGLKRVQRMETDADLELSRATQQGRPAKTVGGALSIAALDEFPVLKDLPFSHADLPADTLGFFGGADKGVAINRFQDLPVQESTLLHELQHAVQEKEGFQRGGSPEEFTQGMLTQQMPAVNSLLSVVEKLGGKTDDFRPSLFKESHPENVIQDYIDTIPGDNLNRELTASDVSDLRDLGFDFAEGDPWWMVVDDAQGGAIQQADSRLGLSAFEQYQRLAGEVEARNVQTRLNMTPEQRRNTPPWETLDVPEDELIRRNPQATPVVSLSQDKPKNASTDTAVKAFNEAQRSAAVQVRQAQKEIKAIKKTEEYKESFAEIMQAKGPKVEKFNKLDIEFGVEPIAKAVRKHEDITRMSFQDFHGVNRQPLADNEFYHGSNGSFDEFDPGMAGSVSSGAGEGFWMTKVHRYAGEYAQNAAALKGGSPNVMKMTVNPKKPLTVRFNDSGSPMINGITRSDLTDNAAIIDEAKKGGFDAVDWPDGSFTDEPSFTALNPGIVQVTEK